MKKRLPIVTAAFPATAAERSLQEYENDGEISTIEVVQQAAREWTLALAGLEGILGILAVVQGRSSVPDLTLPWQIVAGSALAAAVLAATAALVLATLAAQGFPNLEPARNAARSLAAVRARFRSELDTASRRLRWSRIAAVATVFLVLGTVGVTWFAPTRDTAPNVPPEAAVTAETGPAPSSVPSAPSAP